MNSLSYKASELFIIFVLIPISFALGYSPWIKLAIGLFGFSYIIFVLLKVEKKKFNMYQGLDWKSFWKQTLVKFLVIIVFTILFVWFNNKESLFNVMLNKPTLWIFILFVYSVFSVYPQEIIYRTFFFKRYHSLFKNDTLLVIVNALLFSLAHFLFRSTLVLILTFLGGLIFALTFKKTQSTLLVSIEHANYGCWLFTVGMGDILGFPA